MVMDENGLKEQDYPKLLVEERRRRLLVDTCQHILHSPLLLRFSIVFSVNTSVGSQLLPSP
ncbi:hypothetical protein YC2023_019869 [Brassica napus]